MGGRPIHSELQVLVFSNVAREIIEKLGWITYFTRLQQPHETVATMILQNFQEGYSMVRGIQIAVTDEIIVEVSGLPAQGTIWTHKKVRLQEAMNIFQEEGQTLVVKGKGVQLESLGEPWMELAKVVQAYITCDGRKDVVRPRHLKLLVVLKKKCTVNFPAFLNSLLDDIAHSIRKAWHTDMVVSHHFLIRLIVSRSLTQ